MTSYTKTMMEALAEVRGIKTEEAELDEGKMKELHGYIQDGKSAKEIAKIMKLDVKTIKALMSGYNEAWELGTDAYREYLEKLTPGEMDEASARADAMRAMRRGKKEVDPADVDTDATDDDIKGASKNIIMQMRKAVSMRGKFPVEFGDKKKIKIPAKVAQAVQDKYNSLRKPADKEKFQAQVAKSYKDMLRVLKAGYMMKAAYEEVELDEMSPKDKILKKTSDHLQALIKGSNLPDDNAAFSAVRDYVEAGNLKTVADIVKKLDTDPKEAIINAIAKGMGKKEAEKLFKVRITRVEEVEIEKEISELDDLIKELDEGIMGNIAKAAGKSVVKGVKAGGKKVGGAVKKKASGSKIGKAVGKVKSGIKKTKEVGGKIKKAVKTGKAYGDEYDPMLERLEIIETKLNDYYKILEEVELDENGTHVNPKDREDLGTEPSDTAKKQKKAKEPTPNQMTEAQSGDKEAYKKFFDAALKKFIVSSPAELKDDQKKKFYDYIDKNWEGDNEKAEGAMSQVREFKMQSMKAALAQIWGMEEGHNPLAEHKGTKPHKHPHEENEKEVVKDGKTETGKKPATIDLKPKLADK